MGAREATTARQDRGIITVAPPATIALRLRLRTRAARLGNTLDHVNAHLAWKIHCRAFISDQRRLCVPTCSPSVMHKLPWRPVPERGNSVRVQGVPLGKAICSRRFFFIYHAMLDCQQVVGIPNQSTFTSCFQGYYCPTGSSNYYGCPAGYYCPAGVASSTACAAGKFQPSGVQPSCLNCPAGFYCAGAGNTGYTACAVGTYTPSTNGASCTSCSSGQYQDGTGSTGCKACPAGYYCATTGLSGYSGQCESGTYASAGSTGCTHCASGQFQATGGGGSCTACPAG